MSIDDDEDLGEPLEESVEDELDAEEGEPAAAASSGGGGGGGGPAVDPADDPELRTVSSRQKLREEMDSEIERFLSQGGRITEVPANVTADPPKKPESNYGGRPI